jgi:hypothetical protein
VSAKTPTAKAASCDRLALLSGCVIPSPNEEHCCPRCENDGYQYGTWGLKILPNHKSDHRNESDLSPFFSVHACPVSKSNRDFSPTEHGALFAHIGHYA